MQPPNWISFKFLIRFLLKILTQFLFYKASGEFLMSSIKHRDCCTAGFKAVYYKSLSKMFTKFLILLLFFLLILFVLVLVLILIPDPDSWSSSSCLIPSTSIITFIKASRPHQCPTNEFINLQQRLQRLTWISPLLANFDISIKRIWEQTFSHQIIESVKKVDTRYLARKEISNILVILVSFIKITLDNQIYWHWYYRIIKYLIWSM